ncbi:KRAB-A domain-containing protein 2-like [Aphis craccivora]|uniref:KRAB-A domain-containing protein 2-like n=1 Tax=Aphis craccivora TaxID=307492 RepID=A0A6G0ZAE4_APHCR|nr:KRAB-A domain-containing protein 2-like [Aphis craccivora]
MNIPVQELSTDCILFTNKKKIGILKQFYARSQFSLCAEKLITLSDVPDEDICRQKASKSQSLDSKVVLNTLTKPLLLLMYLFRL